MDGVGLIIINLGSPDSYEVPDVRRYLRQFLMDERVIDTPYLLRKFIVEGLILPTRPKRSAKAYEIVWKKEGPPLKVMTEKFKERLAPQLPFPTAVAMRYANPTPADALKRLESEVKDLHTVLLAPMYPHYAMSSYETALLYVKEEIQKLRPDIKFQTLQPFYNDPAYIQNLANSIKPYLTQHYDLLLFSYHGLPVRHLKKSDPGNHCYMSGDCCSVEAPAWKTCYKHQVTTTSHLAAKALSIPKERYAISFQSRLGRDEWLLPFTVERLASLPKEGVEHLVIVCPAFVADCLETLEEIAVAGRKVFIDAGGKTFTLIPCMNDNADWVETFADYCNHRSDRYAHLWN